MNPNPVSIELYRSKAAGYDASAEFTMPLRRRTIALLQLQPGQTVLDVGAGTGLSYALLRDAVGETGQVLAFEQSPEMFALAHQRVQAARWANVWHANAPAETVQLPALADAVLFNYTHDICRTPEAVANILRQVKPGARVAMAGIKFFPWWTGPLNIVAWLKNRPYNAKAADLWEPWSHVAARCDPFRWNSTQWGMGYIASGIYRGDAP
ncbi:MAG: methyltransferase domain-containing protein [Hydrogenophaga sp.]|uniref:class I SAM-dependent methyltransferase n=1 Tax=Hydrogenophaga sp. TaxID=1904254 RepID=UPI0027224E22|nr:methyltransferase domain-containing protein [Hydrogenophaga sp.]MDO9481328.1 methyltransferase domain-containing protein [Hydrogenophaga sp.]MDP3346132.1 methyltransferase domain-containing protein [Hydrogenophaga sp.]MDP3808930.1 methyltransferase domain-containing protein [Hydrogenophaga sp.]